MVIKGVASSLLFTISVIATFPAIIQSQNSTSNYDLCSPFKCGRFNFSFPFFSSQTFGSGPIDCGLPNYQINCDPSSHLPSILLAARLYEIKDLYLADNLFTLVDTQLISDLSAGSCTSLRNLTISDAYIGNSSVPPWTVNLTVFECPQVLALSQDVLRNVVRNYSCKGGNVLYVWQNESQTDSPIFNTLSIPNGCDMFMLPVSSGRFLNWSDTMKRIELVHVLADGFPLQWPTSKECNDCIASAGRCGFDRSLQIIVCLHEQQGNIKKSNKWKLIVGVAAGSCAVLLIIVLVLAFRMRISPAIMSKNQTTEYGINAKQFIKTYQSSILSNYSYNDIKKMTGGFKEKLGKGAYGNVYKGKLSDGRLVAVKLLEKSNNIIGSDFVNEVATIGRIHHVNVINLLGFSWNSSKQALIYEYMPNGSLGDLLSNKQLSLALGLARLLEIAIGIAHGIEYLHNGCESRILHLDIKPQNVLLDQNFHPKLSDFGLAKVYSRSKSAVTMTGARGTIGYIAPEVFMRNLGNPSHKSDVYSYGMLLLEMVGGEKHGKVSTTSTSSDAYFPGWIYDKLTEEGNLELADTVIEEEDNCIARKMFMVGLWCIQMNPKDRPSMTRVVDMLSGDVDSIQMPSRPFFFSPPHDQQGKLDMTSTESDTSALTVASSSHRL